MNGFDDLERQLRRRVAGRAPRRSRRAVRTAIVAACLFASAGVVTAAATGVIGGADRQPVADLLDTVYNATNDDPACRIHGFDRRPAWLSALPAKQATLRAFPQLRRAPMPHERALGRKYGRMTGMKQVLSGGARELRATNGTRFALMIIAGRGRGLGRDPGCFAVLRAELERRADGVEPAVLQGARRALEREENAYRANLGREGLILAQLRPNGRLSSAGGTFSDAAITLGTSSMTSRRIDGKARKEVAGLVPEPADHVIVRPRSGHHAPIRIEVPERVFSLVLPKGFGRRISIEWRAPDGRLLNVLKMLG